MSLRRRRKGSLKGQKLSGDAPQVFLSGSRLGSGASLKGVLFERKMLCLREAKVKIKNARRLSRKTV